jgi:hypothetical protein
VSILLDVGALIAIERGSRDVHVVLKREMFAPRMPITHGGIVGQVWRSGSSRQARLAKALTGIRVEALDEALGRRAGSLLARARRSDVIDAALVLLAQDGDIILTSDPEDLEPLAAAADIHVDIIAV